MIIANPIYDFVFKYLLEVFSQAYLTDDLHKLNYKTTSKNPLVQKMLRRLAKAVSNEKIQRQMDAEDSFDRIISREMKEKEDKINELEEENKEIKEELEALKRALEDMKKQLGGS